MFRVPDSAVDSTFLLTDIALRQPPGFNALYRATVFVSRTMPDLEMLSWCDKFTEAHWQAFQARKAEAASSASGTGAGSGAIGGAGSDVPAFGDSVSSDYAPHEPVAFLSSEGLSAVLAQTVRGSLVRPMLAKYVTVKFVVSVAPGYNSSMLILDHCSFTGLPGGHPLTPFVGTPLFDAKAEELITKFQQLAVEQRGWTLSADCALVQLAQHIARRCGVPPLSLDIVMLSPSAGLLNRFLDLAGFTDVELKSRFGVIKYVNRLVTPLLNYVDLSVRSTAKLGAVGPDVVSLSSVVYQLKGVCCISCRVSLESSVLCTLVLECADVYFTSTKRSIIDALLSMDSQDANVMRQRRRNTRIQLNRLKASQRT